MSIGLFWIICVIAFIAVCYFVCEWLELEEFSSRAWVYAIIGGIWGFAMKHWGGDIYDYCNSWFGKKTTATTASVYIPASSKNSSSTASIIPAPTNTQQISNLERKLQSCSYNRDRICDDNYNVSAYITYPDFCYVNNDGWKHTYSYGNDFKLEVWDVLNSIEAPYGSMYDVYKQYRSSSDTYHNVGNTTVVISGKYPNGKIYYFKAAVVPGTLDTEYETIAFAKLTYPVNLSPATNKRLIEYIFNQFPR